MVKAPGSRGRVRRGLTGWIVAGAGLVAASCAEAPAPPPLNVVLIVVDTLRWDHLSGYGTPRSTSPHLDALARDGVTFRHAYAPSSWTLPSIVSMHTGLYPSTHRVIDLQHALSGEAQTLAEILGAAGYRTFAAVSNKLLRRAKRRLDQGFDVYLDTEARGPEHASTEGVTRQALDALETLGPGPDPFFLYAHYFDPHCPYLRHPQYGFSTPGAGRLKGGELVPDLRAMRHELTDEEITFIRDSYDEEVRWTDRGIGQLLDDLRERGLFDRTVVVMVSDHGEEFLERGWIGHTRTLYEDLVRVPLIVRDPRGADGKRRGESGAGAPPAGRVADGAVTLVGLPATILELLGMETAELGFQEDSFADRLARPTGNPPSDAFLEVDYRPLSAQNAERLTFK